MMSDARSKMEVVTMPDVMAAVFVVDDDISVRESLESPSRLQDGSRRTFESARAVPVASCVLPRPVAWSST